MGQICEKKTDNIRKTIANNGETPSLKLKMLTCVFHYLSKWLTPIL